MTDKDAAQQLRRKGPQPGEIYRHYKGGFYTVMGRAVKEDTLEQLVIYASNAKGGMWARTLENFTEVGLWPGYKIEVNNRQLKQTASEGLLPLQQLLGQRSMHPPTLASEGRFPALQAHSMTPMFYAADEGVADPVSSSPQQPRNTVFSRSSWLKYNALFGLALLTIARRLPTSRIPLPPQGGSPLRRF